MGTVSLPSLDAILQIKDPNRRFEELVNTMGIVIKNLSEINGYLSSKNIKAQSIQTESLAAGAVTAEKIEVDELSAITANMGELTAGSITTDAEINVGTDARIGNILYLNVIDTSQTKGIIFDDDGTVTAQITVFSGDMEITMSGFMTLNPGSSQGVVVNGKLNANALQIGGVDVAMSGVQTGSAGAVVLNGGIPIGTDLAISGGGSVAWSGISVPAHTHTQNS